MTHFVICISTIFLFLKEKSKMKKKILCIVFALVLIVCCLAGCADKEAAAADKTDAAADTAAFSGKDILKDPIKIAFICSSVTGVTTSQYYVVFDEFFKIYDNVDWQIFDGQFDVTIQNNLIQECVTQGYDAIICEVLDAEACNTAIKAAEDAGIPFIDINPGATGVHTLHIQRADYAMGWQGAQSLAEACGNKGNIILLEPPAAQVATSRQGTGAREYIQQNTEMTILDEQYIENWSQENAMTVMTDLLTKYDDIDAIYGANDDMALGAVQALKNAGRDGEGILIWGGNGTPNGLEAVKNGDMYGTSFCNQYNEMCAAITCALYYISTGVNASSCGYDFVPTVNWTITPITKDNVDFPIALWDYCLDYYDSMF
jgi:ABC-type sugar transport system substrate-binding protein